MNETNETKSESALPTLPIRNVVLFPGMLAPLAVDRPTSIAAVEAALRSEDKMLVIVCQRETEDEKVSLETIHRTGTRAVIKRMGRSEETLEFLVQGFDRVTIDSIEQTEPFLKCVVSKIPAPEDGSTDIEPLKRAVIELARKVVQLANPETQMNFDQFVAQAPDPLNLAFLICSLLPTDVASEQALLEAKTKSEALQLLHDRLVQESRILEIRNQITSKAQTELSKEQREFILRRQLKAIHEELDDGNGGGSVEVKKLRERLEALTLPEDVRKEAFRELDRLEELPPIAPDYQLIRSYLELILELPWTKQTDDILDLVNARKILDEDHFGLEEVKDRIIEHLAVLKLNPKAKSPILCFVGPPGVGKTSLGQSIARSMGRSFERLSLGGLSDESELRGHRRTYIGAMPGRLIQALRRAGVNNPLIMLDEIDKLGRDYRGDPSAALLEILDPAQNNTFRDNYLNLPFDLSKVIFITTANTLATIPRPLLDRMEVLGLSGYTEEEKREIAKRYLVPRQLTQAGIPAERLTFTDEAVRQIIVRYTREAGVRRLEQMIGRVTRKIAARIASGETGNVTVNVEDLPNLLGPERFSKELARTTLPPGVASGLAWTENGGEILYIEANLLPNTHLFRLTGHLGKVMKESAKTAHSYVWSHATELGIDPSRFRNSGVHIHVPAGAIPKDGPSAGVALVAALTSLYTGIPVRSDTAMTGEITLTGLVMPVGGVKDKVMAARRAGLTRVILPKENFKDIKQLPESMQKELTIFPVETASEMLTLALTAPTGNKNLQPDV